MEIEWLTMRSYENGWSDRKFMLLRAFKFHPTSISIALLKPDIFMRKIKQKLVMLLLIIKSVTKNGNDTNNGHAVAQKH